MQLEYTSKNERGLEQVTLVYPRTFWQRYFGRPKVEVFERWPTGWRDVDTGEYATMKQRFLIAQALCL